MTTQADRENLLSKLKQASEVRITVRGRKSKRKVSAPVWFILEGRKITLVPTKGSDSEWSKNLVKDPQIELGVGETTVSSEATLVRDSKQVENVLDKFRAKYRSMWSESYYTKRDVCMEVPV